MSDLIEDLRRYGDAVEAEVLPRVRLPERRSVSAPRKTAKAVWWVAAAALAAVALSTTLLALRSTERSPAVTDEPTAVDTSPPIELPLLGFADQPLRVRTFDPDGSYEVFRLTDGPEPAVWVTLTVTRGPASDANPGPEPEGPPSDTTATATVDGREVPVLRGLDAFGNDELTVTWSPSDGTTAQLAGPAVPSVQTDPPTDPLEAILTAATQITSLPRQAFIDALSTPGPDGNNLTPLITSDPEQTVLVESYPTASLTLDFLGADGARAARLEISGPGAGGGDGALDHYAERGAPVSVRSTTGYYIADARAAVDGTTYDQLLWFADGGLYSLETPMGTGEAQALALATSLHAPTNIEWGTLLFPTTN